MPDVPGDHELSVHHAVQHRQLGDQEDRGRAEESLDTVGGGRPPAPGLLLEGPGVEGAGENSQHQ
jgi:hypothetical protein